MANHAEMTFYHGTMGSRKSLELMIDQYRREVKMHHNTLIIKPGEDLKAGTNIQTRFGGEERAAVVMPGDADATAFVREHIRREIGGRAWTFYLDEINFFAPEQIRSLREDIVDEDIADVKMYGLLMDAFGNLFPGSEAALRYADHIIQLDNTCDNEGCDRIAIRNTRIENGSIVYEGPQIAIDGIDAEYMSLCNRDYTHGIVRPSAQ
jgi:thymidine kinase